MPPTKRNFSMIDYFIHRAKEFKPKFRFDGQNKSQFDSWKQQLLPALKAGLGPMPARVPLNPEITWQIEEDNLIKQHVVFDVEEHMSIPALLYIPKDALKHPAPAILCNHGHGDFAKNSVMGIRNPAKPQTTAEIDAMNFDYGLQMAHKGYVTLAIDFRTFGQRQGLYPLADPHSCNIHFFRGSLMGINLLALHILDGIAAIDYLCTLDCVDPNRIGAMGLSFGGTMTTWMAFMDDRIKAADVICYSAMIQTFAITNGKFCGSQYFPGLYQLCDVPDLQGLIAPKPLLAEIGAYDECFYVEEAISCSREVQKIYNAAGAPENFEVDLFDGPHRFNGEKAFPFFDKHLKNPKE